MQAIAVFPGKADSVHLANLPKPSLDDIPKGRGVLVKVLRVGVDGTDREITPPNMAQPPMGTISWSSATRVLARSRLSGLMSRNCGPATMWWRQCAGQAQVSMTTSVPTT